ncbi:MAG: trypsin-like peptidase domain-containing protein [Candidatus Gracilibacteria bacterium]
MKTPQKHDFGKLLIIMLVMVFIITAPVYMTAGFLTLESRINDMREKYPNVTDEEIAVIETVKNAQDSVVSVVISKEVFAPTQKITNLGNGLEVIVPGTPESKGKKVVGSGSGFVVSSEGLIATNKHVVSDKNADYQVVFFDGTKVTAKVVASDPFNDVALLKIDRNRMPQTAKPLVLGSTKEMQIGQTVIAIGNALGELSNSVTKGVISAINRSIYASSELGGQTEKLVKIIQTDAAINLGNSGGPLLNTNGEVIGINTAVNTGAENIGFAIPADDVKFVLQSYETKGSVTRSFIGIRYSMLNKEAKTQLKLRYAKGALLTKGADGSAAVLPNSPAEKAGLKEGDIILKINDKTVDGDADPAAIIRDISGGQTVKLRVWKKALNKEQVVSVKLSEVN